MVSSLFYIILVIIQQSMLLPSEEPRLRCMVFSVVAEQVKGMWLVSRMSNSIIKEAVKRCHNNAVCQILPGCVKDALQLSTILCTQKTVTKSKFIKINVCVCACICKHIHVFLGVLEGNVE